MKKYRVYISFCASFDERNDLYDLLQSFRDFLDKSVPVESFDYQDIKLCYDKDEKDI